MPKNASLGILAATDFPSVFRRCRVWGDSPPIVTFGARTKSRPKKTTDSNVGVVLPNLSPVQNIDFGCRRGILFVVGSGRDLG